MRTPTRPAKIKVTFELTPIRRRLLTQEISDVRRSARQFKKNGGKYTVPIPTRESILRRYGFNFFPHRFQPTA